jgi:hypothetical protein
METALAKGTDTEGQRLHQLQVQGQRKETSPALCIHNLQMYIFMYACPGLQFNVDLRRPLKIYFIFVSSEFFLRFWMCYYVTRLVYLSIPVFFSPDMSFRLDLTFSNDLDMFVSQDAYLSL